jgi:hypothetical protein
MDSKLSYAHRSGRRLDERVIDPEWRKDKLPKLEIEVPAYEVPLPEGVGQEQLHGENLSMREIEEMWKEKQIATHSNTED